MKEVVVLSGKGGTGKTSLVGSFAAMANNTVLTDCDVDAADLHLLLKPEIKEKHEFWSGQTANIDRDICTECGLCENLCRFRAINNYEVEEISCEGCKFCSYICPVSAIKMVENLAGHWYISSTDYGPLVHARLGIAQENSGKLVAMVRKQAKELAEKKDYDYIISDGPPGIGCPVISSLSGAHMALLVTEPTRSGIHDLQRVIGVCQHFGVPAMVCINKFDVNADIASEIETYCRQQKVELAGKLPYDNVVTEAMIRGLPVVRYSDDNQVSRQMKLIWQRILDFLERN